MVGVIGQLAAYDHWRQRVTLIENVLVEPGLSDDELDARYDAAAVRLEQLAADGARPIDEPLVEPPDLEEALPEVRSTFGGDAYCRAVEVIKEHILAGDRSEEHTSELQSLMRISYAVFCLKQKTTDRSQ